MTIHAWRLVKAKHASTAFSGDGARLHGGRWNSRGRTVVYAAGSTSLAMLELLVHLPAPELLDHYVLFEITFDESLVTTIDPKRLSKGWRKFPPPASVHHVGDARLDTLKSAVLRVPSVVVPAEWNYLLNPAHGDFGRIRIGPRKAARFDPRLVKGAGV